MIKYLIIICCLFIFSLPAAAENNEVIILCYHQLVEENPQNSSEIKINDFKRQMEYLHENNYKTLSLEELKYYHQKGYFPEKSVVITFDDGYRTYFTEAFPILEKYNFNSIIFPVVSYLSGITDKKLWSEPLEFWDLRYMNTQSDLVKIGSHTYDLHYYRENNQPAIIQKNNEEFEEYQKRIARDLRVSKELLELQLNEVIIALAWPYGIRTNTAKKIALDTNFTMLFTIEAKPFTPRDNLYSIPRYVIKEGCLDYFKDILNQ